ncbi:MAG: gamma carbonic anhydrase family protein [Rhodospirillaceae bacterium]|nr:gamma carbonic anhydrase family protein [Rhodospirillaceae bacterium]
MALIVPFAGKTPVVAADAFIAPNATLIGDVVVGPGSSIWYGCVLRGDYNPIRIGARSNLQDGTVVHIDSRIGGTTIGDDVTVGHMCLIHACTLESGSFVGNKATVMDGAVVEGGAMVAAAALVAPGKRVPNGEIWAGSPAKMWQALTPERGAMLAMTAKAYAAFAQEHRAACAAATR